MAFTKKLTLIFFTFWQITEKRVVLEIYKWSQSICATFAIILPFSKLFSIIFLSFVHKGQVELSVQKRLNLGLFQDLANNSKLCCSGNLQMVRINLYDFCDHFTFFSTFFYKFSKLFLSGVTYSYH
jgi:hypothetical protein